MNETNLLEALEQANKKLAEQNKLLKSLSVPPFRFAKVIDLNKEKDTVIILMDGKLIETQKLKKMDLKVGDYTHINEHLHVVEKVQAEYFVGDIVTVEKIMDPFLQVTYNGTSKVILKGNIIAEEGDRLIASEVVAIKNIGKENTHNTLTEISWNEIGGLDQEKEEIKEIIEFPFIHKDLFAKYRKKFCKGVVLYGPPGCGKTLLGKASATSLAKTHGASASTGFIYIKGPELLNQYVGASEANIRNLFKRAQVHFKKHGYPAVIFIDEADAILRKRGSGISSDIELTTVATFLAETDGLAESQAMLFLTTNRPDSLDPAIMREGRIDKKIRIARPTAEHAINIFKVHLKEKPLGKNFTIEEISHKASESLYEHSENGLKNKISGALIAELVESSAMMAIKREIKGHKTSGILLEDIKNAIENKIHQLIELKESKPAKR